MWKTLCTQYEGSGTVLEYNAIQEYMRLAYDDYPSLEQFIIGFQQAIDKLITLDIALPEKWYPMNFIAVLALRQLVQAERQRSNARSKDKLSLTALIEDITDEARTKENSKASGSSALYGNNPDKKKSKTKDKNKEKGSTDKDNDKDRKSCPHCKNPNPRHKPDDCLEGNEKKRKEWEKAHSKKWIPYKKYKSSQDSKSKDDDEDDLFGLPALAPYSFNTSKKKTDRWLADTGATDHITFDKSKFTDYTEMTGLGALRTINGEAIPEGKGTVQIQVLLSDGSTKPIRLYDCLYIPSCPINLFSGFKLVQAGGYIKGGFLRTRDHKEICRHDRRLFIIEGEKEAGVSDNSDVDDDIDESVAFSAALERVELNIELWY